MLTHNHPAAMAIKSLTAAKPAVKPEDKLEDKPTKNLDGVGCDDKEMLDSVADYATTDIALKVASAMQEFAETDDLDEGETLSNRLFSLLAGIADADLDGELSDDEQELLAAILETAWDYLSGKGVADDDASALLNDWDEDAAARVQELLAARLPDGDDAAAEDMDSFAFGDGGDEAALDAVYKMKVAVRGGKKMRIKKRVSGTVRLSAKQKVAVRKMLRKSHSAAAQIRRMKSMRIRSRAGL